MPGQQAQHRLLQLQKENGSKTRAQDTEAGGSSRGSLEPLVTLSTFAVIGNST